jgi:hypothetical protein
MATIAPTTAGQIQLVESYEQKTLVCSVDVTAGQWVQETTTGKWIIALADTAPHAAGARLALETKKAGQPLTALKNGIVGGYTISQAYNAAVYLSDTGTSADAAGTVSVVVGRVQAATANAVTASHDKLLRIDAPV